MKLKQIATISLFLILSFLMIGCSDSDDSTVKTDNAKDVTASSGGSDNELRIAYNTQPPTLDTHVSPIAATTHVARHIYEPLVTLDSEHQVVPMLAESVTDSDDGKTYTFDLREGVMFHNGEEMTSEDVVASMVSWSEKSPIAKNALEGVEFNAEDAYTVTMKLQEPNALALNILATTQQFPAIMPKEILDSSDPTGVEEFIGTGPFEFADWKKDQHIHLIKFEDYSLADEPSDGLSGKKEVLIDDVYFEITPDPSTRLAGAETGQYDYAVALPNDMYQQVENNDNLQTVVEPVAITALTFNKKNGLFENEEMRKAINQALDLDELALAAFSNEDLYSMSSNYFPEEIVDWSTDAGKEQYNLNDPEKAKEMLEEAGYNDEEVTIVTNRDYDTFYNASIVLQEQLENIGVNVDLEVTDLATSSDLRDEGEFDLFVGGYTYVSTPIELTFLQPQTWAGSEDPKTLELLGKLNKSTSIESAKEHWNELQEYSWDTLPIIKIADYSAVSVVNKDIEGNQYFDGIVLWNVEKSD